MNQLLSASGTCRFWLRVIVLLLSALSVSGCGKPQPLPISYGKRAGSGRVSVNGTSVLAALFERNGYRVTASRFLGHSVRNADVVVWCPDSFELPDKRICRYFDDWLSEDGAKTLIYIGRDYDGAVAYWQQVIDAVGDDEVIRARERLAKRWTEMETIRAARPRHMECEWFMQGALEQPVVAEVVAGPWSEDPDVGDVHIPLHSSLQFNPKADDLTYDRLLTVGKSTLALRFRRLHWKKSQVIATVSGAWLLNLPLLHDGHRRLAQRLIDTCLAHKGLKQGRVVFLESDRRAPIESSGTNRPYWLEAFTVWPLSSILIHATLAGMVVCLAAFPIFGHARDWVRGGQTDFGRHVRATGRLTAATRDENAAQRVRETYWSLVKHKPLPGHERHAEKVAEQSREVTPPDTVSTPAPGTGKETEE